MIGAYFLYQFDKGLGGGLKVAFMRERDVGRDVYYYDW